MIRYLRDTLNDPAFWVGMALGMWVLGLCLLGVR